MINVIDSIMDSGKSEWAIQYMNENEDKNFIYITPFLDEVNRIKTNCINRKFKEPINKGEGKLSSFKKLLSKGENIASTHLLFSYADDEVIELLKMKNYILILDEVMNVIENLDIDKIDLKMLFNDKLLILNSDSTLSWNSEYSNYSGKFEYIKIMAEHNRLIYYSDTILMWRFPVDVFESFKEVWILTYMFKGQIQRAYYDLYKKEYRFYSIKNKKLSEYSDNERIKDLITVYNDKLNEIGKDYYSLSFSWYIKNVKNKEVLKTLNNYKANYLKHIVKSNSKQAMWTTFKDFEKDVKDKNYNSKSFVPHNSRATNNYRERNNLVYLVNRFVNPIYINFFKDKGIILDEDMYATAELLQWIWRSAIREGNKINLYIPSVRMRELLIKWINQ
jgi:hypothetical protein